MCSLVSICFASEAAVGSVANDKTTEAVVKAVVEAENKPKEANTNAKQDEENKEASAVAKATTEVLDTETVADDTVSERIMTKASNDAKKTFKDLSESGVGSKAAADAAAKVAVATVDGASDLTLPHEAKRNAEKAAVAAGKAVADFPDSQGKALQEAISTVKKEEQKGKVDLKKPEGLVGKAKEAAAKLPKLAEGAAEEVAEPVKHMSTPGMLLMFIVCISLAVFGAKYYQNNVETTPYMKKLMAIRSEFDRVPQDGQDNSARSDLESQYTAFDEFSQMRQ